MRTMNEASMGPGKSLTFKHFVCRISTNNVCCQFSCHELPSGKDFQVKASFDLSPAWANQSMFVIVFYNFHNAKETNLLF